MALNLDTLEVYTPGKILDQAHVLREKRRLLETRAQLIKEEEDALKEHLIHRLKKSELSGLKGKLAKCSLSETEVASASDWDKVNAFIEETDAWDLRNKALNQKALRDRRDAGIDVPGIKWYKQVKINVSKI